MISYLNWKTPQGRETVDELDSSNYSPANFRKEKARLLAEYRMSFNSGDLYWSSRKCSNWD